MIHASTLAKRATVASARVAASASEWSAFRVSLLRVAASASEWSAFRVSLLRVAASACEWSAFRDSSALCVGASLAEAPTPSS
jgi:hypothetical protein